MGNQRLKQIAFTMIEIVFVIVIIAILSSIAIKKLYFSVNDANILKLKTQVALIQDAINSTKENNILKGLSSSYISQLDNAPIDTPDCKLFDNILDTPIISTSSSSAKAGYWSKSDNFTYKAWINNSNNIEFNYDNNSGVFICNIENKYCKQLIQ